jgi:hypothetical protein
MGDVPLIDADRFLRGGFLVLFGYTPPKDRDVFADIVSRVKGSEKRL